MMGSDILGVAAIGLLILIPFALGWGASLALHRPRARGDPDDDILNDSAVLLVADGIVQRESSRASALLGVTTGQEITDVLRHFLGGEAPPAIAAVARLEERGDSFVLLLRTPAGAAVELRGAPSGALIRLAIRDADHADSLIRAAEARMHAAEAALHKGTFEQDALRALISKGPIIAWHRNSSGRVHWSAGQIVTGAGTATPEQVVNMIAARTRLHQQPATPGEVEKARIEIVSGGDAATISVHVVEIVRDDGSRIGFGTDASSATMAERRLARFVQTMTETFAHLTVGLAIFDRNQTLALFNPALVQMWNLEPSWLARRPSLHDILDELRALRRLPEHADFHAWRAKLLELFENPETADYEELWHLADGSDIRVLARPHPHGALAFTFDDVTEWMRLEQRYRHSIDLRRATLDGLTEGVVVFGADGLVQFSNATFDELWRMEHGRADATMHARQLIDHCEQIAQVPEVWEKLHGFITGEESRRSWSARIGTICGRVLNARFAPLPDGSTLGVFHDISESEQIADRLLNREAVIEIAEKAREALHGLIAEASEAASLPEMARPDEPGTGIGTKTHDQADAAPDAGTGAQVTHEAGDSRNLSRDGTAIARLLADAEAIAAQPLPPLVRDTSSDPLAVLDLVVAVMAPRAAARGLTIAIDPQAKPPLLRNPSGRLAQIGVLLIEEAIQHAANGARITLRPKDEGTEFVLGVEISAAGDAPESREPSRLDELLTLEGGHVMRGEVEPGKPLSLSCHFDGMAADGPASAQAPSGINYDAANESD